MIAQLDELLRHLLIKEVGSITTAGQVAFEPPDSNWRTYVSNLNDRALNVYLMDIRENRSLRSNGRVRTVVDGTVRETVSPRQIDCHYLITAWSPAVAAPPAVEPTLEEHTLLYDVVQVLMRYDPIVPRLVYDPNPIPGSFPADFVDSEFITTVLPASGLPALAEFWGTVDWRLKPGAYLIVGLPVTLPSEDLGPMITTRITEYGYRDSVDMSDMWIQIAGRVLDSNHPLPNGDPSPVQSAWIQLENVAGDRLQTVESNEEGQFTFAKLQAGTFLLRYQATGLGSGFRQIDVPSPTGEYDLIF